MIEIKQEEPIQDQVKEQKQAPKPKTSFKTMDSAEADFIRQKIKQNKEYLAKCTSKLLYQKVEKDTLYLENNVLPILLAQTNLFYNELTKKFISYMDAAIQNNCNSIAVYLPIEDNYTENPKVGVGNCRQNKPFGTPGATDIFIEIINMDGNSAPFTSILLDNLTD